jgi:hypothetical protein
MAAKLLVVDDSGLPREKGPAERVEHSPIIFSWDITTTEDEKVIYEVKAGEYVKQIIVKVNVALDNEPDHIQIEDRGGVLFDKADIEPYTIKIVKVDVYKYYGAADEILFKKNNANATEGSGEIFIEVFPE